MPVIDISECSSPYREVLDAIDALEDLATEIRTSTTLRKKFISMVESVLDMELEEDKNAR